MNGKKRQNQGRKQQKFLRILILNLWLNIVEKRLEEHEKVENKDTCDSGVQVVGDVQPVFLQ